MASRKPKTTIHMTAMKTKAMPGRAVASQLRQTRGNTRFGVTWGPSLPVPRTQSHSMCDWQENSAGFGSSWLSRRPGRPFQDHDRDLPARAVLVGVVVPHLVHLLPQAGSLALVGDSGDDRQAAPTDLDLSTRVRYQVQQPRRRRVAAALGADDDEVGSVLDVEQLDRPGPAGLAPGGAQEEQAPGTEPRPESAVGLLVEELQDGQRPHADRDLEVLLEHAWQVAPTLPAGR